MVSNHVLSAEVLGSPQPLASRLLAAPMALDLILLTYLFVQDVTILVFYTSYEATGPNAVPGKFEDSMDYAQRLFHYAYASRNDEVHLLEYRSLQRLNIFHLQNELATLKGSFRAEMKASQSDLSKLKTTLHDYATAIRDYDYLRSMPSIIGSQAQSRRLDASSAFPSIASLAGDPFNSRYCQLPPSSGKTDTIDPLRKFLKAHLPRHLTYTADEIRTHDDEYLAGKPPTTVSKFVDNLARFIIAFIGGASLLVPMLIMTLPNRQSPSTPGDINKSLITTSVAVTLFAATLSSVVKATNVETLAATATYAAVLVVFVGTSS